MNKNFAVEGSYTDYSSDTTGISMSATNGAALEAAMVALDDTAGYKSSIGLTGTTLTGTGTTNAKITSSETLSSGRNIDLSGLYYFTQSDSFEPFVKLGVSAWNLKGEYSAFQYDNAGVLTTIAGATDFSGKISGTDVIYGVGVDGKINDTINNISTTGFTAKICSASDCGQYTCIIILKCRKFTFNIPSANT